MGQGSVGLPYDEHAHIAESVAPDDFHRFAGTRMERVANLYLVTVIMGCMSPVRLESEKRTCPSGLPSRLPRPATGCCF